MNVALPLGNMRELAPVLVSLEKSENRMLPVSTLLLSAGLLVHVAATVPKYNVKPTCRAAIELSAVTGRTVEMCEASEAQARNEIVKAWSTFTEAAKDRCLKTSARHAPSYVELLICLKSMRDMEKRPRAGKSRHWGSAVSLMCEPNWKERLEMPTTPE